MLKNTIKTLEYSLRYLKGKKTCEINNDQAKTNQYQNSVKSFNINR